MLHLRLIPLLNPYGPDALRGTPWLHPAALESGDPLG